MQERRDGKQCSGVHSVQYTKVWQAKKPVEREERVAAVEEVVSVDNACQRERSGRRRRRVKVWMRKHVNDLRACSWHRDDCMCVSKVESESESKSVCVVPVPTVLSVMESALHCSSEGQPDEVEQALCGERQALVVATQGSTPVIGMSLEDWWQELCRKRKDQGLENARALVNESSADEE